MKHLTIAAIFSLSSLYAVKPEAYLLSALKDNNKQLAEGIAGSISNLDQIIEDNFDIEVAIDKLYQTADKFKQTVSAKSSGGGITEAQAQKLFADAKVTVPNITDKAQAKAELINFFNADKAGGMLLKELNINAANVQNALK